MADVVSSGFGEGSEDDGGGRPRWLAGAVVLALAAGLGILALRQGTDGPPEPAPAAAPSAPRPAPAGPADLPPEAVYRLDGVPGPGPAGTRLLVGGRRPGVLDAATGRLTPLPAPGLRPGEDAYVRRGRGYTVVLAGAGTRPLAEAALVPDGGGARVPLGAATDALPLRDGTVLTVACPPGGDPACTVSARTRSGGTAWTRAAAGPLGLLADTPAGLVATSARKGSTELRLVEPRSGRTLRSYGTASSVLAVSDRRLAWVPAGCPYACPVLVADLADGRTRRLPAVAGVAATGAFSADSRRLAVGFAGLHAQDPARSQPRDGYAAVIDLDRVGWLHAPGLSTGPKSAPVPLWSRDRLLLAVTDGTGAGRVASWDPGEPRLTVLPVRLAGFAAVPGEFAAL